MATVGAPGVVGAPDAERGRLQIADRVLARIAARAAREALASAWAGRTGDGGTPRVSVSVSKGRARLALRLALPFPADLAVLARTAQAAVAEQVAGLTGMAVGEVAVTVERLVPTAAVR